MSTDQSTDQPSEDSSARQQKPGELLRQAREKAGISVDDIADRMKLPQSYISDLESSDYSNLPGLVFARGWVRNYANILELDSDELVDLFDRFTGDDRTETQQLKEGRAHFQPTPYVTSYIVWRPGTGDYHCRWYQLLWLEIKQ